MIHLHVRCNQVSRFICDLRSFRRTYVPLPFLHFHNATEGSCEATRPAATRANQHIYFQSFMLGSLVLHFDRRFYLRQIEITIACHIPASNEGWGGGGSLVPLCIVFESFDGINSLSSYSLRKTNKILELRN